MNTISMRSAMRLAATGAALLLAANVAPRLVRAQSDTNFANDTITLITNDENHLRLEVSGRGNACHATTSSDRGVGISIGDDLCEAWDASESTPASLYVKISPTKLTFRQNGKTYEVTDAATVKRARALFAPVEDIAQKQHDLGAQQRALGEKQRDLGRQQRDVKVAVPDMTADFAKVEADAKRLSAQGGTQSELGDLQSELGDLQSRIGDLQSQAGDAESKFGDQQSELGDQQSALGEKQSELGEQEGQVAENVARQLKTLLDQSVSSGAAKAE